MAPELRWGERTYLMGIINVTPDSFSGDGLATPAAGRTRSSRRRWPSGPQWFRPVPRSWTSGPSRAGRARHMATIRRSTPVSEANLAVPVVRALAAELGDVARISIDTSKGEVAAAAVAAGATVVNDVWAARRDPGTADAAAASGAHLVLMHNQDGAGYPDGVFRAVVDWLREAIAAARRAVWRATG